MIIYQPILRQEAGSNHLSAVFKCQGTEFEVWYKTKHSIHASTDVFLVAFLIAAMQNGEDIDVQGPISFQLFNSLDKIQEAYIKFHPDLKKIKITANYFYDHFPAIADIASTATFFTGGADSFYTLLKNEAEISSLIYVHGFDAWLYETDFRKLIDHHLECVSAEFNKQLIRVETNLHEFCDKYQNWVFYHCSALASVALLLSNQIHKIFVAAAYDHPEFRGWGISDLDSLWSTEKLQLVPDGFEANRLEKILQISTNHSCQNHLKVCIDRTSGKYNCCKCEKCIRTMISLYCSGNLSNFKTFETDSLFNLVRSIKIENNNAYLFALENYNSLPAGEIKNTLKIAIDNFLNEQNKGTAIPE